MRGERSSSSAGLLLLAPGDLQRRLKILLIWTIFLTCIGLGLLHHSLLQPYWKQQRVVVSSQPAQQVFTPPPLPKRTPLESAVIVILCRNRDLKQMLHSLASFESRFNNRHGYPYVFLNNEPFSEHFQANVRHLLEQYSGASVAFGLVPIEHWSYPAHIDQERAAAVRRKMAQAKVLYGESESYRFMCRYMAGFLHQHPLLQPYRYYWRLEPGVTFTCDIREDPFTRLRKSGRAYGFVIGLEEIPATIPSLWATTQAFLGEHPGWRTDALRWWLQDPDGSYNGCHFWTNFEIAERTLWERPAYQAYFAALEAAGGFFYERWGDAPIHSLFLALMGKPEDVLYLEEIGYRHPPFGHCPADILVRRFSRCACDPHTSSDVSHHRCQAAWDQLHDIKRTE